MSTVPVTEDDRTTLHLGTVLGKGGFGIVYRGTLVSGNLRRDVAVKILMYRNAGGDDLIARMRDEAAALGALNHPGIVFAFSHMMLNGNPALITEFLDGLDVGDCLRHLGALPPRVALEAVARCADALQFAFDTRGLVHRDIKPQNIRILRHGIVKVMDFGIARTYTEEREAQTADGKTLGTVEYMAPERFSEVDVQDARTDTFALGCVLFEMLVRRKLFPVKTQHQMWTISQSEEEFDEYVAERFVVAGEAIPADIAQLIREMVRFTHADRPTPGEVERRCEVLMASYPAPTLRAWARDRDWPTIEGAKGDLSGRAFTDDTMAGPIHDSGTGPAPKPRAPEPAPPEPVAVPATRRPSVVGVAGMVGASAALVAIAVLAGGGLLVAVVVAATWNLGSDTHPAAQIVDAPPTASPPEPQGAADVGLDDIDVELSEPTVVAEVPPPAVTPAPVQSAGRAADKPPAEVAVPARTSPAVTVTKVDGPARPVEAAPEVTAARPTAHVTVSPPDAKVRVELVAGSDRIVAPADVQTGQYEVVYTFDGRAPLSLGTVTFARGNVVVSCASMLKTCAIQ